MDFLAEYGPNDYAEYGMRVHQYFFGDFDTNLVVITEHPVVGNYDVIRYRDILFIPMYFTIFWQAS